MLTTEGLVLRTVKYGETSLIADMLTREAGLLSTIAGGVRKAKSKMPASCFQLLQPVDLVIYYKPSSNLNRIKEIKARHVFFDLHSHPTKRSLLIFYAEVLQKSIKDNQPQAELYDFLVDVLMRLDKGEEDLTYGHLLNLIRLSRFLGFYPQNNVEEGAYFHLGDGRFDPLYDPKYSLDQEDSLKLSQVISAAEDGSAVNLDRKDRQMILKYLMKYYQWHLPNFGELKSPVILQSVLR